MVKRASASSLAERKSAWRERFARYAGSQQTVAAFCLGEAVSVASFYVWRTRLGNARTNVLQALPAKPAPFIELGSVRRHAISRSASGHVNAPHHEATGINIRLDLGGGVVLHIARH